MSKITSRPVSAEDILWNWARWCWSGETVGNMAPYVSWEDNPIGICHDQARIVEKLHKELPHHEGMVITAEFPQKNAMFGGLHAKARMESARRWIGRVTGIWLTEAEYKIYLGMFKGRIERKFL